MVSLYLQGVTKVKIAKQLGVSYDRVKRRLGLLGYKGYMRSKPPYKFNKKLNRWVISEGNGYNKYLHIQIYEKHHGVKVDGRKYCIRFVDNNPNNLAIENLRMVSRAELILENQNRKLVGQKLKERAARKREYLAIKEAWALKF